MKSRFGTLLLALAVSAICCGAGHKGKLAFSAAESGYSSLKERLTVTVSGAEGDVVRIKWGDGCYERKKVGGNDAFFHQFSTPGTYTVKVSGGAGRARWSVKVDSLLALSEAVRELKDSDKVWVLAHRAHTSDPTIPENSIAAVNAAIAAGADVLETDTHLTKDGRIVICHDRTVDATTDGKGDITKMTLAEIKSLNLTDRNGKVTEEKMPTMEEFLLAARGRAYVNLDYSPRTASTAEVMAIVEKLGMVQQVFLYCNKPQKIAEVLECDPEANAYCRCELYPELKGAKYDYFFQARWKPEKEKIGPDLPNSRKGVEAGFLCSVNMLHVLDKDIPEFDVYDGQLQSLLECYPDCRMIQSDCPDILVPKLAAMGRRGTECTNCVNPFVGTDGHGHTFPAATFPFGMVQAGPDTRTGGWDGCSGYHYSDSVILGFTHTHLSGTGILDYGDILLMPVTGEVTTSRFNHDREKAYPGFYSVHLDDSGIDVSIVAGRRMAMHEYAFPKGSDHSVIVDLHFRDRLMASKLELVGDNAVQGWRQSKGWARNQDVYFYAEFSEPVCSHEFKDSASVRLGFGNGNSPLKVKIALSSVSCGNARQNLLSEKPDGDWNSGRLLASTQKAWNSWLSRIKVTGGTPEQKRTFYTALYHSAIHPSLYSDANGEYRGMDRKVHKAEGFDRYTVLSIWDVFRAGFPLYEMIGRDYMPDFLESMLSVWKENGRLPKWELAGNETNTMIGFNAVSILADAYVKGTLPESRIREYYESMKGTAEKGNDCHDLFCQYGFDPSWEDNQSVSKTLEYAYDNWCVAVVAKALGETGDFKKYIERAQYWKNVFDAQSGFMRPREQGRWVPGFDPSQVSSHFTEANSWQYSFFVPQDIAGHIEAFGGRDAYVAKLDSLFVAGHEGLETQLADVTGLIGQYAHGNEPSHHVAYLYDFAGQSWKTQKLTREICDLFYNDRPDGLCGNEDCGQMSAWYVMSALGLYSVTPGTTTMALTSPLFKEAVIDTGNSIFTIKTDKPEMTYIASAKLNGKPYDRAALDFNEILKGGVLDFRMSPVPTDFGKAPVAVTSIDSQYKYDGHFEEGFGSYKEAESKLTMKAYPQVPYYDSYSAGGDNGLVDGKRGKKNWHVEGWQGYRGTDVDVIVDLLGRRTISSVTAGFLQDMNNYIWMPGDMEVFVSEDGESWTFAGKRESDVPIDEEGIIIQDWNVQFKPVEAAFIRVKAHVFGEIPSWHRGYGDKSFIFIDEIWVDSLHSVAQDQAFKGWPGHDDITDLKQSFANPPEGYGNVPFYWWTGDSLKIDRLKEQLEILSDASTDGLCVSYNHTHDKVDVELNAAGHGPCGRVSGGEPRVMSEQWWQIWNAFSALCAKKGIGLGMDDYVIAWPKNGEFIDSILAKPSINNYQGQLKIVRSGRDSIADICTEPAPWLHPDLGAEIVSNYFQQFADHMDSDALKGMNYFFQDELQYGLKLTSWCEDMREQFKRRKGYDIMPHLRYLFLDDPSEVDAKAARVRLDYAEVLTQLAEERYFKPIYDWNAGKGLIYGCDPEGRGLRPTQYLDYFRAMSWFTAPGNDAPARGSSFRQTKVSSSIAHLYGRPRTWLEAFHSMGWDANGAVLKRQLDHHIIAGGNLLCMHGLYYSTHGGWWEWAPPCFHFRMPYWPHMKLWLKYAERMCFLLSQGSHVCDIAILYPTETMQAVPGARADLSFAVSDSLSIHGLDYDFIDYQSLQKASIEKTPAEARQASLNVAGESYKILILADTQAMHKETLAQVHKFIKAGGTVLTTGATMPGIRKAGATAVNDMSALVPTISSLIAPDFSISSGKGRVLHRRIGERDVYMVMDVAQGDTMHFRAKGKAELWDAMDGTVSPLPVLGQDADGTFVRYDGPSKGSMLVVFSPGEPVISTSAPRERIVSEKHLEGDWDITIIPTMDNKWGDFRLPASDGMIGVEARVMEYRDESGTVSGKCCYGYGPYMMTSNVDSGTDIDSLLVGGTDHLEWQPYVWSWQYGVPDSPGSQGWHGLKAKVDSRFLILDRGGHQLFRTYVSVPVDGEYTIMVKGVEPYRIYVDAQVSLPGKIKLSAGRHSLLLAYANTTKTEYTLTAMRGGGLDERDRSMVIFYPQDPAGPQMHDMYDSIVASEWYGTDFLPYDIQDSPGKWTYRFETAPGTTDLSLAYNGRIDSVEIDGKNVNIDKANGCGQLEIRVPENPGISKVTVTASPECGFPGPAFFREPVKLNCSGGRMPEGDWSKKGALAFYSGAILYSKDIDFADVDSSDAGESIILDLGDVDATCEVSVNGGDSTVLIDKPYATDISPYVKAGANHIEVLVYSSLANHYSTIPSPYRGTPRAGLIGPVKLVVIQQFS